MAATGESVGGGTSGYLRGVLEADEAHRKKLAEVVGMVKTRPAGKRLSMRKSSKSHTPHDKSFKRECHLIDVSRLDQVVRIDETNLTAVCEGRVTIEQLVDAAAAKGLMPAVVPEIHDFTVAGLINGLGIETSSHRFGGFHDIVTAVELVIASGETLYVDEHTDLELFDCLPGSYGTLGIVTCAAVKLVPCKAYVRTRYLRFDSLPAYCKAMELTVGGPHLFIEGFVFSLEDSVLMLSDLVDEPAPSEGGVWDPHRRGAEWIHQHAKTVSEEVSVGPGVLAKDKGDASRAAFRAMDAEASVLGAASVGADFMTLKDYFFRSERGWLWTLEAFVGFKELTDTDWGRGMIEDKARGDYAKMDSVFGFAGGSVNNESWGPEDLERVFVQQDTIWNVSNLEKGCRWVAENIGVWPLWHCPCFVDRSRGPFTSVPEWRLEENPTHRPPTYIVDMGIYGEATAADYRVRRDMRRLQLLMDAPTTFGNVYLSPDEFERLFNLRQYRSLRRRLGAEDAFVPIEQKVCVYDASKPELGKIPLWRLEREGLLTPIRTGCTVTAIAFAAGVGLWIASDHHEDGLSGICADALSVCKSAWSSLTGAKGPS